MNAPESMKDSFNMFCKLPPDPPPDRDVGRSSWIGRKLLCMYIPPVLVWYIGQHLAKYDRIPILVYKDPDHAGRYDLRQYWRPCNSIYGRDLIRGSSTLLYESSSNGAFTLDVKSVFK
jgi:hypothetical protein